MREAHSPLVYRIMKRTLFLISCGLLAATSTWADLDFKAKQVTYEAKPAEKQFEAVFSFTNSGKHPINIKKVESNCGCISAKTNKERYEKGESGNVLAVFKIGIGEGVQSKSINLIYEEDQPIVKPKVIGQSTDSSDPLAFIEQAEPVQPVVSLPKTDRLTVELIVPTIVQIAPKITKWDMGGETETKIIQITMDHEEPINIRSVRSSRDNIRVETNEIEAGKRYEIAVTPQTTEKVQLGMLTIETDCAIKKHRNKLAFYSIQRPEVKKALPPSAGKGSGKEEPVVELILPEAMDNNQASAEEGKPSL